MDVEPLLELVDVLLLGVAGNGLDGRQNERDVNLMTESKRDGARVPDKRATLVQEAVGGVS